MKLPRVLAVSRPKSAQAARKPAAGALAGRGARFSTGRAATAALASIRLGRMIREVVGPLDGPNTYLEPVEPEGWQPDAE